VEILHPEEIRCLLRQAVQGSQADLDIWSEGQGQSIARRSKRQAC